MRVRAGSIRFFSVFGAMALLIATATVAGDRSGGKYEEIDTNKCFDSHHSCLHYCLGENMMGARAEQNAACKRKNPLEPVKCWCIRR